MYKHLKYNILDQQVKNCNCIIMKMIYIVMNNNNNVWF